jgi:hypothetical protein
MKWRKRFQLGENNIFQTGILDYPLEFWGYDAAEDTMEEC